MSSQASSTPALAPLLEHGSRVELQGLVGSKELNGLVATVASPLDPASGRHRVALDRGGKLVNVKPPNLRLRPAPPKDGPMPPDGRAAMVDGHLREDDGRMFHTALECVHRALFCLAS